MTLIPRVRSCFKLRYTFNNDFTLKKKTFYLLFILLFNLTLIENDSRRILKWA